MSLEVDVFLVDGDRDGQSTSQPISPRIWTERVDRQHSDAARSPIRSKMALRTSGHMN
jgi:hypothetical protein